VVSGLDKSISYSDRLCELPLLYKLTNRKINKQSL
jgi:hypothetical protein